MLLLHGADPAAPAPPVALLLAPLHSAQALVWCGCCFVATDSREQATSKKLQVQRLRQCHTSSEHTRADHSVRVRRADHAASGDGTWRQGRAVVSGNERVTKETRNGPKSRKLWA